MPRSLLWWTSVGGDHRVGRRIQRDPDGLVLAVRVAARQHLVPGDRDARGVLDIDAVVLGVRHPEAADGHPAAGRDLEAVVVPAHGDDGAHGRPEDDGRARRSRVVNGHLLEVRAGRHDDGVPGHGHGGGPMIVQNGTELLPGPELEQVGVNCDVQERLGSRSRSGRDCHDERRCHEPRAWRAGVGGRRCSCPGVLRTGVLTIAPSPSSADPLYASAPAHSTVGYGSAPRHPRRQPASIGLGPGAEERPEMK